MMIHDLNSIEENKYSSKEATETQIKCEKTNRPCDNIITTVTNSSLVVESASAG